MKRIGCASMVVVSLLGVLTILRLPATAQCCGTEQCAGDFNCDGQVTVDEIITAVNNALLSCPAPVGADQACTDFATANCAELDQCVLNGSTVRYGGASTCRTRQKQVCLLRLGATGTGNNPADVERCVSQIAGASCNDFDLGNIPECEAKVGSGTTGTPCAFGGQCASTNCALVTGTICGMCAVDNQPGDSCATTSCSHGFNCVAATQQCQPVGIAGATCDADHLCGAGLSCVTPSGAAAGTCQTAGTNAGDSCDPKRQTGAGCNQSMGLYCNSGTKTCSSVTYVTAGGQCGLVDQVFYACTNASTCFGAQGTTPGICIADAPDASPCDTTTGPSCIAPAVCVTGSPTLATGICRFPDPTKCK